MEAYSRLPQAVTHEAASPEPASRESIPMSTQGRQAMPSVNFGFLGVHDPLLVRLAAQAEGYVFTDPETALFKLRQWTEILAKQMGALAHLPDAAALDLLSLLRRLGDKGYLPREVADLLHTIRTTGNRAVHDAAVSPDN